ncbi:MAG: hypothetical protein QGF68_21050, partial [Nitrospinota bacterium]|nr:hypothetical protein [Nitrospinota bacterium]
YRFLRVSGDPIFSVFWAFFLLDIVAAALHGPVLPGAHAADATLAEATSRKAVAVEDIGAEGASSATR